MAADTTAPKEQPQRLLLLRRLNRGWLPVTVVASAAAVAAGGVGVAVIFRPRPAPLAPLGTATAVGVRRAPLPSGLLPLVDPSRVRRRRWVTRVTTPGELDTAGTLGTALGTPAAPGTLAAMGPPVAPDMRFGGDR